MNRSNAQSNLDALTHVTKHLEELCSDMIFVGGCVTGFLITDKAAPDVRFTKDIDCIVDIVSTTEYHNLAKKLRAKGLKEPYHGDHPICRWNCHGVLVDIMPTDEKILGFSNKWYKDALQHPDNITINKKSNIKIISAPFFIGTKLEAFKHRGKNDFLSSHDLEDIPG